MGDKKKVGMISLGCPKNLVDSEVMMGLLSRHGYEMTTDSKAADLLVVNTCGFIDSARQESVDTILEMAELKQTGNLKRLVVAGCLVERYKEELQREIPEIDACVGVNQLEEILSVAEPGGRKLLPIYSDGASAPELYLYDETTPRLRATAPYTAYVKIAEGCDHTCAFCIIPKLRGGFRSRSPESILREVEILAAQGVREFVLISQDTTTYGADLELTDGLARLVDSIAGVPGVEWVRFMYCYPTAITDELLGVMARRPNVCKYFDIPLQHASRRMLARMRRGGNRASYERLIDRIRERVPGVAIRTTFIVGFPGEREEDFDELLDFIRAAEFDRVGVFTYSDEENSAAFELDEKIDPRVAERRGKRLMKEQARLSRRKNRRMVGERVRVLLEGRSKESDLLLEGRMETQAPEIDGSILINDVPEGLEVRPGDFVMVEITEAHDYDLLGKIVQE
ncbi:MAG TPA: 30S ribosomal protein S12 methylthiotransferase RimO [Blastocatellia bacterium]|jgi:ribosomal protein S12 methylthiotransferase|nr:30S ribosomal protein S12 methylthiotransferase RimO [Blastocatellia bacterium]